MTPVQVRYLTFIAALASTVACSSPTAPVVESPEFTAVLTRDVPWSEVPTPPTVRVAGGRVEVKGVIHTPDPCQDLRAEAIRAERRVVLSVIARSRPGLCIAVIGTFAYTAVMDGLAAGTYLLEVVYAYENTGWQRAQVLAQSITVP
jgi:hypothetical protein